MGLKTRLDPRSADNNKIYLKDKEGFVLAIIKMLGDKGNTLEVVTEEGIFIEKPNGWSSKT